MRDVPVDEERDYPMHLDITEKKLKQIKDWKVGKCYKVIIEIEMTGIRKGYDGEGPIRGDFIVTKIESAGEVKGYEKETKASEPTPTNRGVRVGSVAQRALDEDDDDNDD